MAYPQNFLPWQQTRYTAGPFGAVMDTARDNGPTTDQDLLNQTYDAQQSLLAITKASRLKHLTDLNMALRRMGQAPGGDGTYAVAQAERNPYPGIPGNPMTTGFGMPSAPGGIYPGGPVAWTPPLSAAQQMARMRPVTAASASPYPRYNSDGSLPAGIPASGSNPRLDALRNITRQISQDEIGSLKDSLYTPLEPYLSPFERQLALAQARGGSERAPNNVNVGGGNAAALAAAAARGTTPTANATLTDNRVRANNDTKQAEQLIYNGGITTQAQLQDQFPDADWNRLGALLGAMQQGQQKTYDSSQNAADLYNQDLDKRRQALADQQADADYKKGYSDLPSRFNPFGGRSAAKDDLNQNYNADVFGAPVDLPPDQIPTVERQYQNSIQYDPASQSFVSIAKPPVNDERGPGYISRQDMPGQNFHTDLQRSPVFNGLPIVRTQADYNSLPLGAQAVTGDGQVLPPKGGRRGGPSYATGYRRSGGDEFAQDFADAGYASNTPQLPSQTPSFVPGQAVNFGNASGAINENLRKQYDLQRYASQVLNDRMDQNPGSQTVPSGFERDIQFDPVSRTFAPVMPPPASGPLGSRSNPYPNDAAYQNANVGNAVNFGGQSNGPRMMSDGTYVVADPSDLVYVPAGATFIGPDGIRRQKH